MSEFDLASEALSAWDRGESVWSMEMGGIGPGYEQAIQVLVFEIVRDQLDSPMPPAGTPMDGWADDTVRRVGEWPGCGFSGAQVGAAKWLAYRFLTRGHKGTLDECRARDRDRLLLVSQAWPHKPESRELVAATVKR